MTSEIWGRTDEGDEVHRIALSAHGLTMHVITWGSVIQDLRLDGVDHPLVLGFPRFEDYPAHSSYFGAIAGRYANRIAGGTFTVEGVTCHTDRNFLGRHTLHGGAKGIGKRVWRIAAQGADFVELTLIDRDGEMGFPGTAHHTCRYTLQKDATLRVDLTSMVDRPCPINLTNHSYFNLDGSPDTRDHQLTIHADIYLPVDDELIPLDAPVSVDGTPFDFRRPRTIRDALTGNRIFDHNFCLANRRRDLTQIATLSSNKSGMQLDVATTEPGLQFYAGHKINTPVPGLSGTAYGAFSGIALEAQLWPDGPNHPDFPATVVHPGETSRQVTTYRFSRK